MKLFIFWIIISYLFGSLNTALIISKVIYKKDIRNYGSRNSGSTNISRVYGKKCGISVFIIDVIKPIGLTILASQISPEIFINYDISYLSLFIIIGQCYPIFYKFKGGKGAACTLGMLIILYPKILIIPVVIFLIILCKYNIMSLASIIAIGLANIPIILIYLNQYIPFLLTSILVIYKHKQNIINIIKNEEPKFFIKS